MEFTKVLNEKLTNKIEELNALVEGLNKELSIIDDYISSSLSQISYVCFGYRKERESDIEKNLLNIKMILPEVNLGEIINNINNGDVKTLIEITDVINKVRQYIEKIELEVKLLSLYNKIFNNQNMPAVIFDMNHLFRTLNSMFASVDEVNKGLGIIIAHNSKFMNDNISNRNLMRQLSKYYKKDGMFKENIDYVTYKKLMEELLLNNKNLAEEEIEVIKEFISKAIELLRENNEMKQSTETIKVNSDQKKDILAAEDFELISLSRKIIENSDEIEKILEEIDYLFSILDDITDEEEKEYYKEELSRLIADLRNLNKPYEMPQHELEEENKFIFLLDDEYNSYAELDTNKFEGNQRKSLKKVFEMISKIKVDDSLLPILPLYDANPVFYKRYNNVCVAFSKLPNEKYLIIGAWGSQEIHKMMNTRARLNLRQITRIKECSPEAMEKLSEDHYKYYQQIVGPKKDKRTR